MSFVELDPGLCGGVEAESCSSKTPVTPGTPGSQWGAAAARYHVPIDCQAQNYEWGKAGVFSAVARLKSRVCALQGDEQHLRRVMSVEDIHMPFAELWMGTHPNGPSRVVHFRHGGTLSEFLSSRSGRRFCGEVVWEYFPPNEQGEMHLPFLLKVLSVEKALSIQAHPDKSLAEELHAKYPDVYKDNNHKPEMAIALTHFEAFCSFRPLEEFLADVDRIPLFRALLGIPEDALAQLQEHQGNTDFRREFLRQWFSTLMSLDNASVEEAIATLLKHLGSTAQEHWTAHDRAVPTLVQQFGASDIGILCTYFLNFVSLAPGQALFLAANEPHAYFRGDCVECMATSDNVVRAGLTPKLKDTETLCNMLTYRDGSPADLGLLYNPTSIHGIRVYQPPVPEFQLHRIFLGTMESHVEEVTMVTQGPCVLLVVSGFGSAKFSPADDCTPEEEERNRRLLEGSTSAMDLQQRELEEGEEGEEEEEEEIEKVEEEVVELEHGVVQLLAHGTKVVISLNQDVPNSSLLVFVAGCNQQIF